MPDSEIMIYPTAQHLAEVLASEIAALANKAAENDQEINIALSGGSTPLRLYKFIAEIYADEIDWKKVHLFWSDERCVPESHPDSNYGFAKEYLLNAIPIPSRNVHYMKGDNDPEAEADKYTEEIKKQLSFENDLPCFDLVILGLGSDGHTASIFSDRMDLLESDEICSAVINPASGQRRITLTGKVINNARSVIIMATGVEKSGVVAAILDDHDEAEDYTAAYIYPEHGTLKWYLDEDAATDLE